MAAAEAVLAVDGGEAVAPWRVREAEPPGYGDAAEVEAGPRTCAGNGSAEAPTPSEPAPEENEELEALGRELVKWAAHQAAAEHRFLVRLAEFDRREGWKLTGDRNCADWLARHARYDVHTAQEKVRVAESLEKLPLISEAMSEGRLSYSQVRLLRRVATEECEEELLKVARHSTVKELERFVRGWPAGSRTDEDKMARQRRRSRRLAVVNDEAGMTRVMGRLTAEEGAMLEKALEAAEDLLYGEDGWEEEVHERRRADALVLVAERALEVGFGCRCGEERPSAEGAAALGPGDDENSRGARARAEAEAGFGEGAIEEDGAPTEGRPTEPEAGRREGGPAAEAGASKPDAGSTEGGAPERQLGSTEGRALGPEAGALGASHDDPSGARARPPEHGAAPGARAPRGSSSPAEPAPDCRTCGESAPAPLTGTRAERYQVFVHVDLDTLRQDGEPGRSELADGTRLAPETARRLTCGAALVPVHKDEAGNLLNVGRRQRAFPPAIRRALEVRDRGCRFPGCGIPYTVPHHVTHWSDGGETSLANGLLLCGRHHWLVHEGGWDVHLSRDGRVAIFVDPRGRMHPGERPRAGELPGAPAEPMKRLMAENLARGVDPDEWSLAIRYHPDRTRQGFGEVPWSLQARALEAMDEAHFGEDEGAGS